MLPHVPVQQQAPVGAVPGVPARVASKVFPQLLQKRAPDLFNVFAGSWRVQRAKASTARVVCWQELGLVNRWVPPASSQMSLLHHTQPQGLAAVGQPALSCWLWVQSVRLPI